MALQEDYKPAARMGWQWSVTSGPSPCLQASSMSVGLQGDSSLQVEISDAVSEWSGTG